MKATFDTRPWRAGEDPVAVARRLVAAHDQFLETGLTSKVVRPLVAQSWHRCTTSGVDPVTLTAPVDLDEADVEELRRNHPLAPFMPIIRRLIVADAVDCGLLVAVSDAQARLLWVEGHPGERRRATQINFVEGATWSESRAGTNAPGTALAVDRAVQIYAAEHLAPSVTPWSCTAAPIHDPATGEILGALDVTGGPDVAAAHTLSLVRATVAAVEAEMRVRHIMTAVRETAASTTRDRTAAPVRLQVLGRPAALLVTSRGPRYLSRRHSDLAMLLASRPEGSTGEQLAADMDDLPLADVTVRAEVSRLRALLDPVRLSSRPYRLEAPLPTDVDEVRSRLAHGDARAAVEAYAGPVLPLSTAPGVERLRDQVHQAVRDAVLGSADAGLMVEFGSYDHGRLDYELWTSAPRACPSGSPLQGQVSRHLAYLDHELG